MIIVVVKDSLVESYNVPLFFANAAVAIRAFSAECNRDAIDNPVFANRSDYDLIKIGEYDEVSGVISSSDAVVLVHGRDVVRRE